MPLTIALTLTLSTLFLLTTALPQISQDFPNVTYNLTCPGFTPSGDSLQVYCQTSAIPPVGCATNGDLTPPQSPGAACSFCSCAPIAPNMDDSTGGTGAGTGSDDGTGYNLNAGAEAPVDDGQNGTPFDGVGYEPIDDGAGGGAGNETGSGTGDETGSDTGP